MDANQTFDHIRDLILNHPDAEHKGNTTKKGAFHYTKKGSKETIGRYWAMKGVWLWRAVRKDGIINAGFHTVEEFMEYAKEVDHVFANTRIKSNQS